jgi:hemin uptake protein HemP
MSQPHKYAPGNTAAPPQLPAKATPRVASSALFGEATALVIVHNGREYLLRVTQNGKLILTA